MKFMAKFIDIYSRGEYMSGYQEISISVYREIPEFHASFRLKDTIILM